MEEYLEIGEKMVKPRKALEREPGPKVVCTEQITEQAHKRQTDINWILRDYAKTGLMKHVNKHQGKYDDVSVADFQEAMFKVKSAQAMFDQLPAQIRRRFGHDPAMFLEFVQNPSNIDEMAKLGILKGNDGIDINGAAVEVPTKAEYDEKMKPKESTGREVKE